ncbi:MAG: hypothetical protein ACRDWH_04595 [Acidimicrobiia bacterium]
MADRPVEQRRIGYETLGVTGPEASYLNELHRSDCRQGFETLGDLATIEVLWAALGPCRER